MTPAMLDEMLSDMTDTRACPSRALRCHLPHTAGLLRVCMPGGLAQAGERELIRITVWGLSPRRQCRRMGREHSIWVSVLLGESYPAPHRRCENWAGDPWATPAILPAPGHGAPKIYQDSKPGSAQFHQEGLTSALCGRQEASAVCGQGSPPSLPAARARSPGADEE